MIKLRLGKYYRLGSVWSEPNQLWEAISCPRQYDMYNCQQCPKIALKNHSPRVDRVDWVCPPAAFADGWHLVKQLTDQEVVLEKL